MTMMSQCHFLYQKLTISEEIILSRQINEIQLFYINIIKYISHSTLNVLVFRNSLI